MNNPGVFAEIEPETDPGVLEPGMYTVGCAGRFHRETVDALMRCSVSAELVSGCVTGFLMPYYMHNLNNLLVGVVGNLDLAEMFMPHTEKVAFRISEAKASASSVTGFIRSVSETLSSAGRFFNPEESFDKAISMLRAACGRSVRCDDLENMKTTGLLSSKDQPCLNTVMAAAGVWCVLCLGGNGSINGITGSGKITFIWEKPSTSGRMHMPGSENASLILAMAGGLAGSRGYRLIVENWTDFTGTVTIAS